jgi:SagB-type dehydrogenase family enzyme
MPLLTNQIHLNLKTEELSEDALYYHSTKGQSEYYLFRYGTKVSAWLNDKEQIGKSFSTYKTYTGGKLIALKPNLKKFRKIDWEKVVLSRKSSRHFDGKPMTLTELSNLLVMTCGLKEKGKWLEKPRASDHWPKRALPSGGAMYPLELYVLAFNVKGLEPGVYHYSVFQGGLRQLKPARDLPPSKEFWTQHYLFENPSAIIFVTSIFKKSRVKYGARSLRFILIEAGGIGVQMNLLANAMGLDFCFDGGGFDDRIEEMLGLNGRQEGLITTYVVGHAKA